MTSIKDCSITTETYTTYKYDDDMYVSEKVRASNYVSDDVPDCFNGADIMYHICVRKYHIDYMSIDDIRTLHSLLSIALMHKGWFDNAERA